MSATIGSPVASDVDVHPMRSVYDAICNALERLGDDGDTMVILDDITSLEWIGFPQLDLIRFSRALRSLCFKVTTHN